MVQVLPIWRIMSKKHTGVPDKVRKQREEAARIEAEKALTEKETQQQPAGEPSLKQRLADIDRRAKERAEQEKSQLAAHYYGEAKRAFIRAVSLTQDEAVKSSYETMLELEKLVGNASTSAGSSPASTGRTKRNAEQLKADAEKLVEFLKKNPGSNASQLKEVADFGISPSEFIEKYSSHKIKKEGSRANMTYSLAH